MINKTEQTQAGLVPFTKIEFAEADLNSHVLSETSQLALLSTIKRSKKIDLGRGLIFVNAIAREGLHPVIIRGIIKTDEQIFSGNIFFGKKGNLPKNLEIKFFMLGAGHFMMQQLPETIAKMCNQLEKQFYLASFSGSMDIIPISWSESLRELAQLFELQQAGFPATIITSTPQRASLDDSRIAHIDDVPIVIHRVIDYLTQQSIKKYFTQ